MGTKVLEFVPMRGHDGKVVYALPSPKQDPPPSGAGKKFQSVIDWMQENFPLRDGNRTAR